MPALRDIRKELTFSQRLLVSRGAWYLYSNADFAVAGRVLGGAALGVYNMAWNLAYIPVDRLLTLILRVTPSVFSKVQDDLAELRRYLRILTEGTALVTFPVALGLALVADSLVGALFDRRWAGLVLPLRLLALNAALRCLTVLLFQVQNAIRDVRYAMWQSLVILVALPPAFWYASRWGGAGIAAVWVCVYPILVAPALPRILRKIGMPARQYLEAIRPAALASLSMVGAVLAARYGLPHLQPMGRLIVQSVTGAGVYLGVLFIFFRPRVNTFLGLASAPVNRAVAGFCRWLRISPGATPGPPGSCDGVL
jgi:O-antigen/teichoic acid export membrane protein